MMEQTFTGSDGRLYLWQPNGTGGVNYFTIADFGDVNKLAPITREVFESQTGADVGMIEHQVANDYTAQDDVAEMPWSPTPTGTTGTTGTARSPNWAVISGTRYDLNDPGQFQAYISAADQLLNSDFEEFRSRAERVRDEDIAIAKAQEDEILYNINRALQRVGEQEGQYNTDWARSVADLAEGYRQGSARRQAFYASVAPRVYQSSQGTSQQYAENKFKEGQVRYDEDKTRAMKGFADTRQDYEQQRQNTINQFNLYKTQREAQAQDEIAEQARAVRQKRDEAMAGALNYSGEMRNAGGSSNRWSTPTFAERNLDYSPSQVNLNDLMQFIKFQPAGVATGGTSYQTQAIATPEAGGQALGTYLGYQPEEEEGSTLNKYKKGYAY